MILQTHGRQGDQPPALTTQGRREKSPPVIFIVGHNRGIMTNYNMTFIGLVLSVSIYSISIIFDIELFETVVKTLESLERFEVDEFVIPVFILLVFSLIDHVRRSKLQQIERERIKLYTAVLSSTHQILNSFLDQMEAFKSTADNAHDLEPAALALHEHEMVIEAVSTLSEALCAITDIDEESTLTSVAAALDSHSIGNMHPLSR